MIIEDRVHQFALVLVSVLFSGVKRVSHSRKQRDEKIKMVELRADGEGKKCDRLRWRLSLIPIKYYMNNRPATCLSVPD